MNRLLIPDIKRITSIKTNFPEKSGNIYKLISEEGVFKLEIVFPGSGYGVIQNKFAGLYAIDLILSGTGVKQAGDIADEIDKLGGYVFKACDFYTSSITIFGLNENISTLVRIIKNSLEDCVFNEDELEIYKRRKISELNLNLNKTSYLANRSINRLILGSTHPYSLPSSEPIINQVTPEDLLNFKNSHLKAPYYIFTGSKNTPIENILLDNSFSSNDLALKFSEEIIGTSEDHIEEFIPKEGSSQNSIRLGKILPSRDNKDYFKISLVNLILGGYFGSRLMKNIREEKGLTYGIHSSIVPFKCFSLFKISSECNSTLTDQVKKEILKEIELLQTELVNEDEIITAKNYLIGALSRNFDGAFNISERLKSSIDLNLPANFYQDYFTAINQITPTDIRDCAYNYFELSSFKYCVSGAT